MPFVAEPPVRELLNRFQDPETGRSIVQLEQVHKFAVADGRIDVTLGLTSWAAPLWDEIRHDLESQLCGRFPGAKVQVAVEEHRRPATPVGQFGLLTKSVIAVGAGKGGVGKSSIASYLAAGLARAGAKVGL